MQTVVDGGNPFPVAKMTEIEEMEGLSCIVPFLDFLESEGYIAYAPEAMCTTKDFYDAYKLWCEDNLAKIRSETSFSKEVKELSRKYNIAYVKNVPTDDKMARGYKGVYALHPLKGCPFPYR